MCAVLTTKRKQLNDCIAGVCTISGRLRCNAANQCSSSVVQAATTVPSQLMYPSAGDCIVYGIPGRRCCRLLLPPLRPHDPLGAAASLATAAVVAVAHWRQLLDSMAHGDAGTIRCASHVNDWAQQAVRVFSRSGEHSCHVDTKGGGDVALIPVRNCLHEDTLRATTWTFTTYTRWFGAQHGFATQCDLAATHHACTMDATHKAELPPITTQ
jgi:hypothetical protein